MKNILFFGQSIVEVNKLLAKFVDSYDMEDTV